MVKITETPDGLELRSTSWYEIENRKKELTAFGYFFGKNSPFNVEPGGYDFIEDHIETDPLGRNRYFYVITLRKVA